MADLRASNIFEDFRTAAKASHDRFLVATATESDCRRVAAALAVEGNVVQVGSVREAFDRLAEESFDLLFLDGDQEDAGDSRVLLKCRELRPFADVVLFLNSESIPCGQAFLDQATGVLPRPFPDSDALLRAHVRWLVSGRRARNRGMMLTSLLERHRLELVVSEPALAGALAGIVAETSLPPTVAARGDDEIVRACATLPVRSPAGPVDVVVVGLAAGEKPEAGLQEARGRAPGAALVVVDAAPGGGRLRAALYAGARAYLDCTQVAQLNRAVELVWVRRRREIRGRRFVETLAKFGVLDDGDPAAPAPPKDVDAQLIADATTGRGAPVVPSGHEVLVVDDEIVVLTVLREALRRGGYKVTTAASAEEAIDLMNRRPFDLILTDKNLPGASGLEVLRVSRTLDPAPAVVLITGYSSYDSAVEALDIGALDYIEKPIRDLDNLRFRIRRALSRRDEQMSRRAPAVGDGARGRVLVVELEETRRKLMGEFLGQTYQVTTAVDGDDALRLLQEAHYDVVVADRNLPGMSGLRVIEQAQRLLPHCASVLYTAYPSYETVKEAFDLGVDAFLIRPSEDLKNLAERVAGALRSRGGILLG